MQDINIPKELGRAAIAGGIAFLAALLLKALGAGKWLAAAGSGTAGGIVAIAASA
jgi:hypothetical protein